MAVNCAEAVGQKIFLVAWAGVFLTLTACNSLVPTSTANTTSNQILTTSSTTPTLATIQGSPKQLATIAPTIYRLSPTVTQAITQIIPFTPTIEPTPTLDPYAELTIEHLVNRSYGEGSLEILDTISENSLFTRYLIVYPSDGLQIYGFMNVPKGEPPFPVIIALHGYIDPDVYQTLDYTTTYADALARAGYLVLHPNLRGYPPSDEGPNLFRVGMAIDVLNLIALVKESAGRPGPLEFADAEHLGLWGHSMGGGISLRVLAVYSDVDAAVLYAAMSGDEKQNYEAIYRWSNGQRGLEELSTPPEVLPRISPIYYLDHIQAAVSIHHGRSDELIPLAWSLNLCQRLSDLGKTAECFIYDGQLHTFQDEGNSLFLQRMVNFFDRYLKSQ